MYIAQNGDVGGPETAARAHTLIFLPFHRYSVVCSIDVVLSVLCYNFGLQFPGASGAIANFLADPPSFI